MKNRQNKSAFFFFMIYFFLACGNETKVRKKKKSVDKTRIATQQKAQIEEVRKILKNGCIVLRTGNDVISAMFAQLNKINPTYSHCGIAFLENEQWYVYHSIGGEDNPDAKLRRETFNQFVSADHNLGMAVCQYPLDMFITFTKKKFHLI
jgi:hypothetical protein